MHRFPKRVKTLSESQTRALAWWGGEDKVVDNDKIRGTWQAAGNALTCYIYSLSESGLENKFTQAQKVAPKNWLPTTTRH